jgi:hypothetical protein
MKSLDVDALRAVLIRRDEGAQESVALNLMLAVQICVDLGSHVRAARRGRACL